MHRANRGARARPTDFDADIYKGRNVVERSFNGLRNWRGIVMRSDKTARTNYAGVTAAILIWINTDLFNTPRCNVIINQLSISINERRDEHSNHPQIHQ